jgi:hypothetical protein
MGGNEVMIKGAFYNRFYVQGPAQVFGSETNSIGSIKTRRQLRSLINKVDTFGWNLYPNYATIYCGAHEDILNHYLEFIDPYFYEHFYREVLLPLPKGEIEPYSGSYSLDFPVRKRLIKLMLKEMLK